MRTAIVIWLSFTVLYLLGCGATSSSGDDENLPPVAGSDQRIEGEGGRALADITETDPPPGGQSATPIPLDGGGQADSNNGGVICTPGEPLQCLSNVVLAVCNEDGDGVVQMACPMGAMCEDGQCRGGDNESTDDPEGGSMSAPEPAPGNCVPGEPVCADVTRTGICQDDNTLDMITPCPAGASCRAGTCLSDCQLGRKVRSYVGCEYWSVDLDNYPDPAGNPAAVPHAVAISNTSDAVARIVIEGPEGVALNNPEFEIEPNDLAVFTFPRLDIDGTGIFDRAFKITADWPVVVYQFNPLNNEGVASNDASLLLPAEGLGIEYVALSWPTSPMPCLGGGDNCLPPQHGYVTVIATSPGVTNVRVTPAGKVAAGGGIEALDVGVEQEFELNQGQVLNLQADAVELESFEDILNGLMPIDVEDMSGTLILADRPIAVFGGHEEAVIGRQGNQPGEEMSSCCAEHLEQQLLPVSTWGTRYLAARSEPRGGSREHWRIVSATDNNMVTTIPPQPDSASFTLNRGEFHEIISDGSFEIVSTAPVMVAQYLVSQTRTQDNVGDPAMIVAPPVSQLRDSYQIITPQDYSRNWLTIARPVGTPVTLDDVPIDDGLFSPFGSGDYEVGFVAVDEGVHRLEGEAPFSLTVYGYSAAVSYGYPGGLNLRSDREMMPRP